MVFIITIEFVNYFITFLSRIDYIGVQSIQSDESNNETKIPTWVMCFIGSCAVIVPFFGRTALLWFVDLASVGASIAYFITCLCAYKISLSLKSKVIGAIGMFVSMAFLMFLLTPFFDSNISLPSYFSLIFWIVFGVIVYVLAERRLKRIVI